MRVNFKTITDKKNKDYGKYVTNLMIKKTRDHKGPYPVLFKIVAIKNQGY